MSTWLNLELKRSKKEKKRCKKLYSDWKDDEFNCGANKFIFGILSKDNKVLADAPQTGVPSFQTLNCMQVYYNRDTQKYLLDIDLYNTENKNAYKYLSMILTKLRDFICEECKVININNLIDIDLFTYLEDMSNYWSASTLPILYFKLFMFTQGYNQLCKNNEKNQRKN